MTASWTAWAAAAAVAAGALGLSTLATGAAQAADLPGYGYSAGPPDDDPRYNDMYHHAPPPPPRYAAPYPPRDDRGYLREMPPPPAWQGQRYGSACAPRHVVRAELERQGWFEFRDLEPRGDVVHFRARRDTGQPFDLTIDRCTGQVLDARPLDYRAAQAGPPRRYRDYPPGY